MSHAENLLLALFALQHRFVSSKQLVASLGECVDDPHLPLDRALLRSGCIEESQQRLLRELIAQHRSAAEESAFSSSVISDTESAGDSDPFATVGIEWPAVERLANQRFLIKRELDKGGLGIVSVGIDQELKREVAIKEIKPEFADNEVFQSKFLFEAEVTGGLEHPGVVPVYGLEFGADGRPFYAMRLIRGNNLQFHIDQFHVSVRNGAEPFNGPSLRKLLRRLLDICNTVEYAHSRGVIHRDLKPANVMIGKYGETLVVDWGLAKTVQEASKNPSIHENSEALFGNVVEGTSPGSPYTVAGEPHGTPEYASPEQMRGHSDAITGRSDLYGLGGILYQILCNQPPLTRGEALAVEGLPAEREPSRLQKHLPHSLEAICLKALSTQPEDRYPSARAMGSDIERWLDDEPVHVVRESWLERGQRWIRKHQTLASILSIVTLMSLVGAIGFGAIAAKHNQETEDKNLQLAEYNQRLNTANIELEASERNLRASNETTKIANQKLKEKNQELSVKEDELKKSNTAVKNLLANERQLTGRLEEENEKYLASLQAASQASVVEGRQAWAAGRARDAIAQFIGALEYDARNQAAKLWLYHCLENRPNVQWEIPSAVLGGENLASIHLSQNGQFTLLFDQAKKARIVSNTKYLQSGDIEAASVTPVFRLATENVFDFWSIDKDRYAFLCGDTNPDNQRAIEVWTYSQSNGQKAVLAKRSSFKPIGQFHGYPYFANNYRRYISRVTDDYGKQILPEFRYEVVDSATGQVILGDLPGILSKNNLALREDGSRMHVLDKEWIREFDLERGDLISEVQLEQPTEFITYSAWKLSDNETETSTYTRGGERYVVLSPTSGTPIAHTVANQTFLVGGPDREPEQINRELDEGIASVTLAYSFSNNDPMREDRTNQYFFSQDAQLLFARKPGRLMVYGVPRNISTTDNWLARPVQQFPASPHFDFHFSPSYACRVDEESQLLAIPMDQKTIHLWDLPMSTPSLEPSHPDFVLETRLADSLSTNSDWFVVAKPQFEIVSGTPTPATSDSGEGSPANVSKSDATRDQVETPNVRRTRTHFALLEYQQGQLASQTMFDFESELRSASTCLISPQLKRAVVSDFAPQPLAIQCLRCYAGAPQGETHRYLVLDMESQSIVLSAQQGVVSDLNALGVALVREANTLKKLDLTPRKPILKEEQFDAPEKLTAATFHPSGMTVACATESGEVYRLETESLAGAGVFDFDRRVSNLEFSSSGRYLATTLITEDLLVEDVSESLVSSNTVRICDMDALEVVFAAPDHSQFLGFSPSGNQILFATEVDDSIAFSVYDLAARRFRIREFVVATEGETMACFVDENSLCVIAHHRATLFDLDSEAPVSPSLVLPQMSHDYSWRQNRLMCRSLGKDVQLILTSAWGQSAVLGKLRRYSASVWEVDVVPVLDWAREFCGRQVNRKDGRVRDISGSSKAESVYTEVPEVWSKLMAWLDGPRQGDSRRQKPTMVTLRDPVVETVRELLLARPTEPPLPLVPREPQAPPARPVGP